MYIKVYSMEGNKYDEGKPPVAKLLRQFPNAIRYLSFISQYGHNKYGTKDNDKNWDNWKYVSNRTERYDNAHMRHSLESLDHVDESGFLSIGHTAWNALAILESILLEKDLDDLIVSKEAPKETIHSCTCDDCKRRELEKADESELSNI